MTNDGKKYEVHVKVEVNKNEDPINPTNQFNGIINITIVKHIDNTTKNYAAGNRTSNMKLSELRKAM